jgi:hypothetical protein
MKNEQLYLRVLGVFLRFTRKRRMRRFQRLLSPTDAATVLDVGGTPYNWQFLSVRPPVALLNYTVSEISRGGSGQFSFVRGDARRLPYGDAAFDVVYSNSVIEHLGSYPEQQRMAAEVRRVGRKLWVQTPARGFFIEPHLLAPLVHWLPKSWQRRLLRNFTLWGLLRRPSRAEVDAVIDEVRLLGRKEMQTLFPDCRIIVERFLGWPKSYIAVRAD